MLVLNSLFKKEPKKMGMYTRLYYYNGNKKFKNCILQSPRSVSILDKSEKKVTILRKIKRLVCLYLPLVCGYKRFNKAIV